MNSRAVKYQGFTLVELLVVIGIIALLIAIILPSLSVARQAAARTACAAKLHSMMQAAQIHVNDHKGYFPICGFLPGNLPANLDDNYSSNYTYFSYSFEGLVGGIAPITIALSSEMAYGSGILATSNTNVGNAETDDQSFIRNFICPSQASSVSEIYYTHQELLYTGVDTALGLVFGYQQAQSYVFNEAILGWTDSLTDNKTWGRKHGKVSQIRQQSRTFFACDGVGGSLTKSHCPGGTDSSDDLLFGLPWATIYNISPNPPITLLDAYSSDTLAGDYQNFDRVRHRNRINIAFCDGHVEMLYCAQNVLHPTVGSQDLAQVFVLAP